MICINTEWRPDARPREEIPRINGPTPPSKSKGYNSCGDTSTPITNLHAGPHMEG